jgi:hypothetical protein
MRSIRHPLSGALYGLEANGVVRVTGRDGKTGFFRPDGSYLSGDLYFADPHLCGWIGGSDLNSSYRSRHVPLDREEA